MTADLEEHIFSMRWFYRYELPSGRSTALYIPDEIAHIHTTRCEMMLAALAPLFGQHGKDLSAIDISSHQGFFSIKLAPFCRQVTGLEYQQRHVDAANLIKDVYGLGHVRFIQENVETMPAGRHAPAEIVLIFGLLFNLENP